MDSGVLIIFMLETPATSNMCFRQITPNSLLLLIGLVLLCLSACGPKVPTLHKSAPLPQEKICRIAIFPFVNETDYPQAGTIFYRIFIAELARTGQFEVAQEGDIREVYRHLKIRPGQQPNIEQMKILGDRLGVRVVITGAVVEMTEVPKAKIVNPTLAVSLKIIDSWADQTLWSTYHRREGERYRKVMHFGVLNTVTSLAHQVSKEILELWFMEGFKGCID
jgi:TolB-like protein